MPELKGITYANQPFVGIPIAAKILNDKNTTYEEYISAVVYLGYRILDNSYANKEYEFLLNTAFLKCKELDVFSASGYRWYLSLNLINACLNALTNNPPKILIENLKQAYSIGLKHSNQLCNYSKIGTLIYYQDPNEAFKSNLMAEIKKHMVYGEKIEQMSFNALNDVIIPLLSDDKDILKRTVSKYKNWYIYKDYINTLCIYKNQAILPVSC